MSESSTTASPQPISLNVISPSTTNIELIEKNVDISGVLSDATSNPHEDDNDSVIADIFDDMAFNQPIDNQIEEPISHPQISKSKNKFLKKVMFGLDRKTSTCCSTQFSCISCLSMLALLLNIASLLAIIGLSIASNVSYQSVKVVDVMSLVTEATNMHTTMGSRVREVSYNIYGYVPSSVVRSFYTSSKSTLLNDLKNFTKILPPNELKMLNSIVDSNFTTVPNSKLWETVLNLISSSSTGGGGGQPPTGNGTSPVNPQPSRNSTNSGSMTNSVNTTELLAAQKLLESEAFIISEKENTNNFDHFLGQLIQLCWDSHNLARSTLIACLVLICASIALVIPFAVLIFLIGLISSSKDEKKLFKANTILLFETMESQNLRPLFEKFCMSAGRERQFNFISKTRDYSQLCKRSLELQMRTFEITQDILKGGELIEKPNALTLKQVNQNEKFLKEVEYMKQQVAFELLECMDMNYDMGINMNQINYDDLIHQIDQFNNKEDDYQILDILPVDLFEKCEHEVVQSLIEVHNYFKQTDDFVNAVSIIYK
ncbi:predicted protein [Naegleria gruberi]|uniref:Predicted protein n=1 Tax=Naegleria gruberi TaxID=5762 RepID=D2VY71_NAEGR|nr:uncharacterized protein NAEGRDRAFT_73994 [Naegleria gruberi]EFC38272.1 predicted protein [Naegleria gruberi]|eukprot:XP_002671016.1 predicted protein [Naegleria gruberi strain NEG-M]